MHGRGLRSAEVHFLALKVTVTGSWPPQRRGPLSLKRSVYSHEQPKSYCMTDRELPIRFDSPLRTAAARLCSVDLPAVCSENVEFCIGSLVRCGCVERLRSAEDAHAAVSLCVRPMKRSSVSGGSRSILALLVRACQISAWQPSGPASKRSST